MPGGQSLTRAVGSRAGPGPVGRAVPRGQPRGLVAVPAGVDDRAGEQDAVAADDPAVGGRAGVPTGHGCGGHRAVTLRQGPVTAAAEPGGRRPPGESRRSCASRSAGH